MRRTINNDPRKMAARFASICPKCKSNIQRGELITYWPCNGKAYHFKCSESDWNTFINSAQDEAMYSGTPYESHDFNDEY